MASLLPEESSEVASGGLQLRRWSDPAIIAIAFIALASGFGQYGAVAALGDVSKQLGHVAAGGSIADKVGLSGTSLGVGLAIIRLASLGSLPLIGMADRLGRRRVILGVTIAGLALTVVAAASPGYWWFVVIFAFGRPLLSATNALAGVMSAEETGSRDRSAAVAFVAGGYGVGAGLSAIVHSLASSTLGFRGIFALAIVPLVGVYAARRWVEEPSRFMVAEAAADHPTPVWGAVGPRFRGRVIVLAVIGFAISVVTGPANSFAFLYAQDVLHLQGWVTAATVTVSGLSGLLGLVAGRWLADHVGRRPTGTVALVAIACTGALAYTGSDTAYVLGYILGVFGGGLLAPVVGSLLTELFPTSVRASVTGWWVTAGVLGAVIGLVAFGAVADVGNRFAAAGELVFLPAAAAAALFWFLPETKGREPESMWPDAEEPGAPTSS
ncbi:MAG TPA: MFS transporter [Acidimicrobiales bacterium]